LKKRFKAIRFTGIAILIITLIYFGFKRERYLLVFDGHSVVKFLNKYPRIAATDFKKEMSGLIGFSLSPKLTSSILFSLIYLVLTSLIIQLIFSRKKYTYITIALFAFYMVICFLLIQLGNFGLDYHISFGLSHYLEDLFLSPFPLMLLIPLFIISEKMLKINSD
jgi:hypothetical protein